MFEGIRRNIRETVEKLKDLNLGKTDAKQDAAKRHRQAQKKAVREFLGEKVKALDEYDRLIAAGRDPEDDHLQNLRARAAKADAHAEQASDRQARFTKAFQRLTRIFHRKSEQRKILERQLDERRENLRRAIKEHQQQQQQQTSGVVVIDGKPVAAWIAAHVLRVRANGWNGVVNSGWRSPEYSEQLCYQICGAPVCPGRCAGRTSNHTKKVHPDGAVDVSDPATFGAKCRALGIPLYNYLGTADPWHYSSSGR